MITSNQGARKGNKLCVHTKTTTKKKPKKKDHCITFPARPGGGGGVLVKGIALALKVRNRGLEGFLEKGQRIRGRGRSSIQGDQKNRGHPEKAQAKHSQKRTSEAARSYSSRVGTEKRSPWRGKDMG